MADGVVYTGFDPAFQDRLNRLLDRAKAEGYAPSLISGTRAAYAWPGMKGQSQADLYSQLGKPGGPRAAAPPGYSPHQYGVAGDVTGIPQSELERLAPLVGLRAIHSDPNHVELAGWQQEAASQPPRTPWDQTNPVNVPSQYASNVSTGDQPAGGGFAIPPGGSQAGNANILDTMRNNIGQYESGGDYNILGKRTNTGDQAVGRYQVMKSNIPSWTQKWLGHTMTPDEFRADPKAQDAVFNGEFGSYLAQYSPADAASKWFTGQPLAQGANKRDILGTSGARYVASTIKGVDNPYAVPGTTLTSVSPDAGPGIGSGIPTPAQPNVAATAAETPPPNLNPFQKLFTRPEPTKDAKGNDVPGKSPIEKLAGDLGGMAKSSGNQAPAAPEPAQFAPVQDPMAQMAPAAAQLYSTIQAQAAKPLSWSSRPYGWDAGLQMTAPGMSLNTTGYGNG